MAYSPVQYLHVVFQVRRPWRGAEVAGSREGRYLISASRKERLVRLPTWMFRCGT
jgi:hypothetical protein